MADLPTDTLAAPAGRPALAVTAPRRHPRWLWGPPAVALNERGERAFPHDYAWSLAGGVVFSIQSIAQYVCLAVLGGSDEAVGVIGAAIGPGLILTVLWTNAKLRGSVVRGAAIPVLIASLFFVPVALTSDAWVFALCVSVALLVRGAVAGSEATIIGDNYDASFRGRVVGWIRGRRMAVAVAVSLLFPLALREWPESYRILFPITGAVCVWGALRYLNVPEPVPHPGGTSRHPIRAAWEVVKTDRPYVLLMMGWFSFGFGAFMSMLLTTIYLVRPEHGIGASAFDHEMIKSLIPNIIVIFASGPMGVLFDRLSLPRFRALSNLMWAGVPLTMAFTTNLWWIGLASIGSGLGRAGNQISWALVGPQYAGDRDPTGYNALHTFLTGVRAVIAPGAALWITRQFDIQTSFIVSAVLMILATVIFMLIPEPAAKPPADTSLAMTLPPGRAN